MGNTGGKGPSRLFFGQLSTVLGILLALSGVIFITNVVTLAFLGIPLLGSRQAWGQEWGRMRYGKTLHVHTQDKAKLPRITCTGSPVSENPRSR